MLNLDTFPKSPILQPCLQKLEKNGSSTERIIMYIIQDQGRIQEGGFRVKTPFSEFFFNLLGKTQD